MQPPKLVALTGLAGCGKSTAADYLIRAHGFVRVKFSGPLKDMLRAIGLTDRHIEGDLKEEPCALLCGQTPRYAMQTLGTEWGRDTIDPALWQHLWHERAADVLDQGGRVVVDDCRFPNEAGAVRALGGTVVLLEGRATGIATSSHSSEAGAGEPDYTMSNASTVEELYRHLSALVVPG